MELLILQVFAHLFMSVLLLIVCETKTLQHETAKKECLILVFFRRMDVIYLISHAALPDWSVNKGELSRARAESVNFKFTIMNMRQWKPTQLEHTMKAFCRRTEADQRWHTHTYTAPVFQITRAEWETFCD